MTDAELIAEMGGPARLAEVLGYDVRRGGVQRVHNWISRGIPASVKVAFPEVFLRSRGLEVQAPGCDTGVRSAGGVNGA